MLLTLNALQLVLYIALLALVGQGLLSLLAGAKRESNFFYKTLTVLTKPFTRAMRFITPKQVADQHVPLATFLLLLVMYAAVTFEKVSYCVSINMTGCK